MGFLKKCYANSLVATNISDIRVFNGLAFLVSFFEIMVRFDKRIDFQTEFPLREFIPFGTPKEILIFGVGCIRGFVSVTNLSLNKIWGIESHGKNPGYSVGYWILLSRR